jgi:uncharacterized SAM-binding protein YcdF (DUF218 family)
MRTRAAVVLVLAAAGVVAVGLAFGGRLLVASDPVPAHADAIVVLAGSIADRTLEAADLLHAGVAPRVVVTRERRRRAETLLATRGVRLPAPDAIAVDALVGLGVPRQAIVVLRRRATSTTTEARTIARWACSHRLRTLVVVTSKSHSRRARLIVGQALGPRVRLAMRPSRYDAFSPARWFRVRRDAKLVLREWEKLVHYALQERWQIEPCGGLARRARYAFVPSISEASSPRACSSRTMSQPPTNFPLT